MSDADIVKFNYDGRRVLVTGGTSGIGLAIARGYRDAGAKVVVTGRRASAAEYEGEDLSGFEYFPLVSNDQAQIDVIAKSLPVLDVLVNNAGETTPGGYDHRYEPDRFEDAIEVNLLGQYRLSYALRSALAASDLTGGASVINLASMSSYFGMDAVPGYGASKAAIVQITKTLAIAWAHDRIRVNAIAPGNTRTRIFDRVIDVPEVMDALVSRTPLGRFAEPEEMVGPVLFLTSPHASFITGQTLPVCGGYSIF